MNFRKNLCDWLRDWSFRVSQPESSNTSEMEGLAVILLLFFYYTGSFVIALHHSMIWSTSLELEITQMNMTVSRTHGFFYVNYLNNDLTNRILTLQDVPYCQEPFKITLQHFLPAVIFKMMTIKLNFTVFSWSS